MTNGKCEYQSILLWRVFAFDNHQWTDKLSMHALLLL